MNKSKNPYAVYHQSVRFGKTHLLFQKTFAIVSALLLSGTQLPAKPALVFQSDFGDHNALAATMHAIANGVDPDLTILDIRHNITPFDIEEAARSLNVVRWWPSGTVFVSVVDPGVGTPRKSVVLKTKSGHYIVSPDNGSLAIVAKNLGIEAVREIDESVNRIKGSEDFHTFHGRDVYSFTGARLASGTITYKEVGPLLDPQVVSIDLPPPASVKGGAVHGIITSAGGTFGNVGTNIGVEQVNQLGIERNGAFADVTIRNGNSIVYRGTMPYIRTFGEVEVGRPLLFSGASHVISISLNQANFSETHGIEKGPGWTVEMRKSTTR